MANVGVRIGHLQQILLQEQTLHVINGLISFVLMQTMSVIADVLINTITITTLCV
jgi:hypothetical protein